MIRVKICGIKSSDDLKNAVEAGADAVGLLVGQLHASPDFILPSTALRLASELPPYISPVIVTHLLEAEEIYEILKKTSIWTVQLHGTAPLSEVKKLRKMLPDSAKIIQAVNIVFGTLDINPEEYAPYINAIVLDSYNRSAGERGAPGRTYNWEMAEKFVKSSRIPVILAGGLNETNVGDAVKLVRPYGIDANTGLKGEDGFHSLEKCRKFVVNAKKMCLV